MRLPIGIDVEQYKAQAEELLERGRLGEAEALARFREHIPKRESSSPSSGVRLADAQLVIARENGFAGDVARLEALIDAHPGVLRHECRVGEWYEEGYFSGARLLQHVAGNPDRGPLPPNIVDIARLLATRHFDRKAAEYTIGLLLTSRRASEAEVAMPLIDILVAAGARFDVGAPQLLSGPLLNAAPETAEALVRRGAKVDLRHAAGLGDVASLRSMLEKPTPREELEEALAFACIRDQRDSAALLLARGAKGDVLVAPGGQTPRTALHEAANRGFVELVEMLLAAGADATVKDSRWGGTAAAWADEGDFPALATRLRSNP
jgi:hypothetical protein